MERQDFVKRQYSSKTLVGNWFDTRFLEEADIEEFLRKCANQELTIQQLARLSETFMAPTPLTESTDQFLRWENNVVLLCPKTKEHLVQSNYCLPRPSTIICATIDECIFYGTMKLKDGTRVGADTCLKPFSKAVFKVISPECCPPECIITYGVIIQLKLANDNSSEKPLYLASDFSTTAGGSSMKSGHRNVVLINEAKSYQTHWRIEHANPQLRLESEGLPVKVNVPVIIRHCKTNSALAVEKYTQSGFYGRFYEVSSHNFLDGHKAEMDCNFFQFCTNLESFTDESGTINIG